MSPSQHVIYQGALTDIPVGRLQTGATQEVELPMTFVSCGDFELHADVHAYNPSKDAIHVGQGCLRAFVETL